MSRAWGEKPIDRGLMKAKRASSLAMRSLTLLLKAGWSALYIEAILKATRMARAMERMSSSLSVGMGTDGDAGAPGSEGPGVARSLPEDMTHLTVKKDPGIILLFSDEGTMLRPGDSRGDIASSRPLEPRGPLCYLSLIHISEPTRRTPISYAV